VNRAISGQLVMQATGRPLFGHSVLAGRLLGDRILLLGQGKSGPEGRFRIEYAPLLEPPDLTVLVFDPAGRLLFIEPPHRCIQGAELQLVVEVG